MKKQWIRRWSIILISAMAMAGLGGCGGEKTGSTPVEKQKIVFADVGWDSIKFHNAVAGLIAEKAYGLTWEEISGTTPIIQEALKKGDVDVHMEIWPAISRIMKKTETPARL